MPVHPAHLERIPPELRGQITLQCGYGAPFGVEDQRLTELGFPLADRDTVLGASELVILPKPIPDDLARMAEGAVLWGWPHAVQQRGIAQVAIDRRLTLLAFEAMFQWDPEGTRGTHVFHRNNELAGYCGILDALRLTGLDGSYGRPRRTIILSFGSVSRGAAHALKARGFTDITALTLRPPHLVQDQQFGVEYGRLYRPEDSGPMTAQPPGGDRRPLIELLADADVIVNGTLQNPENPLMFVREGEEEQLRPGSLIVDVSCDEGMGFHFARPTTFEDPMFTVGDHVRYYAVDHTPSYLWDAASWEISNALLPYLPRVAAGPEAWDASETLRRAIEIRNGTVRNPVILSFQNRAAEYPHPRQASEAGA